MKGDGAAESAAGKLDELADKAAARGGVAGKFADELAADASFLRKLKPSLMVARARGEAPKNQEPGSTAPRAPRGPQHGPRAGAKKGGPNPLALVAGAFAAGTLLAKMIDWRSHAHPRR